MGILAIAIACLASDVNAQVAMDMDAKTIAEAISLGQTAEKLEPYEIRVGGPRLAMRWEKLKVGGFTTPFLRVALSAFEAKKLYRPFTGSDVTDAMTQPTLEIYTFSMPAGSRLRGPNIINVQSVVITGKDGREPVIQASETAPLPIRWRNLLGFSAESTGMLASFPLEAFRDDTEVHVIYESKVGGRGRCTDCKMRVDLENVR